jgi:AraC-like DNA-binding protein
MNNVPLQRVAGLAGAPDLLRELGADPVEACAGLSIGLGELHPDAMIPFAEAMQLLANCERASGRDDFGAMLGARCDHLSLGPIGQLMQVAPTLGDAIRDYVRVQIGLSRGAAVYSYPLGDDVTLGFGIYARHHPGVRQAYGFTMAVAANLVRALTGGKARISEVLLCHRAPADRARFERLLGAKARFDQYQSCVIFARVDLARSNPGADPARYESLSAQLAAMMQVDDFNPGVLLRHRIKPLLMQGCFSLEDVARALDLHPRTLNRRLLEAGTSFIAIRDEIRFRLAQELLALTDLPIGEIAAALSFSAHGNFVRAFRRWAGETPTQWRLNRQPGEPRVAGGRN